jgi:hypothetical protein
MVPDTLPLQDSYGSGGRQQGGDSYGSGGNTESYGVSSFKLRPDPHPAIAVAMTRGPSTNSIFLHSVRWPWQRQLLRRQ